MIDNILHDRKGTNKTMIDNTLHDRKGTNKTMIDNTGKVLTKQ
jgi:hypothetical protein